MHNREVVSMSVNMLESVQSIFQTVILYAILFLEAIGAVLIVYYSIRAFILLLKGKSKLSRTSLTEGITTGLSFLLGSEVLKTIVAPDWSSIGMTCAILLMRAAVTILVHWENKVAGNEEEQQL